MKIEVPDTALPRKLVYMFDICIQKYIYLIEFHNKKEE